MTERIRLPIIGGLDRALEEIALDGCDPDQATIGGTRRQGFILGRRLSDGRIVEIRYRSKGVPLQRGARPNSAWATFGDLTGHDGVIQGSLNGQDFQLTADAAEHLPAAWEDAITEAHADGTSDDDHDAHLDRIGADR